MATFTKFEGFVENLAEKAFNLGSDTLKVILTNTLPDSTLTKATAILTGITQIAGSNGYTTNGTATTITSSVETSGTYKLIITDVTFTASGGSMGAFRYVVLYDSTATNGELIGFWDYGTNITITNGNSFLVDFDGSAGVLTLV